MNIYLSIQGKRTGPFEDEAVLAQLVSGTLSPNEMAIREGDLNWSRLGDIFAGRMPAAPVSKPYLVGQNLPRQNTPQNYNAIQAPNYSGCFQQLAIRMGTRLIAILVINMIVIIGFIVVMILFFFLRIILG